MGKLSIEHVLDEIFGLCLPPDLTAGGISAFPGSLRHFILWFIKFGPLTREQLAGFFGKEEDVGHLLTELTARGLVEHVPTCGVPVYRVCLEPRRLAPPPELLDLFEQVTLQDSDDTP